MSQDDPAYTMAGQSRISRIDGRASVMRETTPSRVAKSARNIKLSNNVVVATTVNVQGKNTLQIQQVPITSLP
jgi:hypothetical protein